MSKKKEFPILDDMERLLGRYGKIGLRELMLRLERLELEAESREPEKLNNAQESDDDLPEDTHPLAARLRKMADNVPHDFNTNDDLRDGYYAGVFDAAAELDIALAESSLSSPPPKCMRCHQAFKPSDVTNSLLFHVPSCPPISSPLAEQNAAIARQYGIDLDNLPELPEGIEPTFRQSLVPTEPGAESVHSGKQNTADKSGASSPELLPTQLPKEK